ncbi:hypothetical protein HY605_02260, partial [Candidatus Peregrinibacteria bacterium]|nr:hypothetical protein [Candidatus Peregrinibacteria bacterium]
MHFSEFAKDTGKDKVLQTYIFCGEDDYLKQEGVKHLKQALNIPGENISRFSVVKVDEALTELPKILDELYTGAFNGRQKLVIVSDSGGALSKDADWVKDYVDSQSENVLAVLTTKKPSAPKSQKCVFVECDIDEDGIISYVSSLLSGKKIRATRDTITELCQRCAF